MADSVVPLQAEDHDQAIRGSSLTGSQRNEEKEWESGRVGERERGRMADVKFPLRRGSGGCT